MSCDFYQLANPGVRDLTPYEPGKPIDELERVARVPGVGAGPSSVSRHQGEHALQPVQG